jgi:hypothetical protein
MPNQNNVIIQSASNQNVIMRMDGGSCSSPGSGPGCGTVNGQFGPGPWEYFNIIENNDGPNGGPGTVSIASVHFPSVYLRMDGPGGIVNCQWNAGPWEKFIRTNNNDGTFALQSNQFPGYYLSINPTGITQFNPSGWPNVITVTQQTGPNTNLRIPVAETGFRMSNLTLNYNTRWRRIGDLIFGGRISMGIRNATGSNFPTDTQSSFVSVDVYASLQNNTSGTMFKIGEIPANLGTLAQGGAVTIVPSDWDKNNFANRVTTNPAYPASGQYYIYVQVRNATNSNLIDGSGTFSSQTYLLPPVSQQ